MFNDLGEKIKTSALFLLFLGIVCDIVSFIISIKYFVENPILIIVLFVGILFSFLLLLISVWIVYAIGEIYINSANSSYYSEKCSRNNMMNDKKSTNYKLIAPTQAKSSTAQSENSKYSAIELEYFKKHKSNIDKKDNQ